MVGSWKMKHFLSGVFFSSELWKAQWFVYFSDRTANFFLKPSIVENFTSCQHGRKSCTYLVCESSVSWLHEQSLVSRRPSSDKTTQKKTHTCRLLLYFFSMFFLGGRWGANFGLGFFLAEKGVSKIRFEKMRSESVVHPEVRFVGSRSLCYTRTWKGPWGSFFLGKKSLEFLFFGLNSDSGPGWWVFVFF